MRRPQHISLVGPWLFWSLRFKNSEFEARRLRLTGRFEGDELNTLGTPLMVAHDLIKLAKLPDASILVDLGAGHGAFLVAGLLNGCAKVVGVEAHGDLASGLRPLLPASTCELISGDCRELLIPTGNLYIAAWTTWTPQTRAQIRQQLQFVPKGAKLWVWTHEMEEPEWALRRVHRVHMPGYKIQVFLYEKV